MFQALLVVTVVTVVLVGLMVGVELSVAAFVNPILDRLPDDGGLAARSDAARVLGRVMPFWYIGAMILTALWATLTWGQPAALPVTVSAVLLATSVAMSILLLVPINNRVAQWSTGGAPADWRQQLGRWDRLHYLRVAAITAAFALLVTATT